MAIEESIIGNQQVGNHSFEKLFKLYHAKVYSVCLRMTGTATEAEDLTQEVFLQVFRKLGTFRGESAFSTWLHRLTVNQVLMHFRKMRRKKEQVTEDGEMPERNAVSLSGVSRFSPIDRIALDEAILKLSPGYRLIFILHDVQGLQHLEIADIVGCSVGTSKSQLHKARLKLRSLLRQRFEQAEGSERPKVSRRMNQLRGMCLSPEKPHECLTINRFGRADFAV